MRPNQRAGDKRFGDTFLAGSQTTIGAEKLHKHTRATGPHLRPRQRLHRWHLLYPQASQPPRPHQTRSQLLPPQDAGQRRPHHLGQWEQHLLLQPPRSHPQRPVPPRGSQPASRPCLPAAGCLAGHSGCDRARARAPKPLVCHPTSDPRCQGQRPGHWSACKSRDDTGHCWHKATTYTVRMRPSTKACVTNTKLTKLKSGLRRCTWPRHLTSLVSKRPAVPPPPIRAQDMDYSWGWSVVREDGERERVVGDLTDKVQGGETDPPQLVAPVELHTSTRNVRR